MKVLLRRASPAGEGTYRGERLGALRTGDYVYVDTTVIRRQGAARPANPPEVEPRNPVHRNNRSEDHRRPLLRVVGCLPNLRGLTRSNRSMFILAALPCARRRRGDRSPSGPGIRTRRASTIASP